MLAVITGQAFANRAACAHKVALNADLAVSFNRLAAKEPTANQLCVADYSLRVQAFVSGPADLGIAIVLKVAASIYFLQFFSPLLWSKINRIYLCAGKRLD